MSEEQIVIVAEFALVASMLSSFVLLVLMITLFFRKTLEAERRIATQGKQLDDIRMIWGNGPIGRWMRVLHVYFFFLFRNFPGIGPRIEARMGDEKEPLPLSLKLWVLAPFTLFAILMFLFFLSGWYLSSLG